MPHERQIRLEDLRAWDGQLVGPFVVLMPHVVEVGTAPRYEVLFAMRVGTAHPSLCC